MWTAVGVILGAYVGLPPIAAVPLAAGATFVGGRLAAKAAEESCSHGPELQQKNDLYFLLRLHHRFFLVRNEEAEGSNSFSSTRFKKGPYTIFESG